MSHSQAFQQLTTSKLTDMFFLPTGNFLIIPIYHCLDN